ncbi:MAG: biosynthetic-type acetolactate synthase large subunit [Rickettsiales bacterium]
MKVSGAEIVIRSLVDCGVDVIFGYPGGAVLPLYDKLFLQDKLRHILVRHEQAAAHAAEGYARSTGKIGALLVTSGPGATNTVTGLTDALLDSVPLICISGQVATHLMGSDAFQEADTVGITRPCTKYNYLVTRVEDVERVVKEACYIATSGRPGPVLIDIPKDVQNQSCDYLGITVNKRASYAVPSALGADDANVDRAADLLLGAERPVFYTGGGVINSGDEACRLLTSLVRQSGAPVTSTLMGLGGFPMRDPQFLGMLGMHGSYQANMAMAECDVMINVGARFDDRITGRLNAFSVRSRKIHIDVDPSSVNKNVHVDVAIVSDVKDALEKLIAAVARKGGKFADMSAWKAQVAEWTARNSFGYRNDGDVAKPQFVLQTLNRLLRDKDAYVTTDVGQHQMWAAQHLSFDAPRRWMTSGGLGTMGYGLPAAVGVQIAYPDAVVVCVTGEASIQMNIQELATALQYRLPVKVLILNNQYMGMVRQWQELFHGDRHSETYMDALPDFVALAEAYHMTGLRCERPEDVEATLVTMLETPGPVVCDMQVAKSENVYPMIPAGAAHYEMELGPEDKIAVDKDAARNQV